MLGEFFTSPLLPEVQIENITLISRISNIRKASCFNKLMQTGNTAVTRIFRKKLTTKLLPQNSIKMLQCELPENRSKKDLLRLTRPKIRIENLRSI